MSAVEESVASNADVTFAKSNLQPPSQLYVTREDHFFIDSWNSAAGASFDVRGRVLLPNGRVVPFVTTHTPNTNRVQARTLFAVPEGFLLNVMVVPLTGSLLRGQCFVRIGMGRGDGPATLDHHVLIQGYVTNNFSLTWPGDKLGNSLEGPGAILSISGTQPGAGADWGQFVPTGARWRPIAIQAILTTSAAVANRNVRFRGQDAAANTLWSGGWAGNHPASNGFVYSAANFGTLGSSDANNTVAVLFPPDARLFAGWRLNSSTANIQAGDQWTAPQFLVEEWIEI